MSDIFSSNHLDLIQLRNKGKRLHRRTQSTFNLDFIQPIPKESDNEFAQEMTETHNILDANITQKILDAPLNYEADREIIIDDIEEIPYTGAIAPKLSSSNNPLTFIKRRNLSAIPSNIGNSCPIKKINLLLDNNLDDIIGLDTIYEKRNSVESLDQDDLKHANAIEEIEFNIDKNVSHTIEDTLKETTKTNISELKQIVPKTRNRIEKKSIHIRQSSADFVFENSRREGFDCWDKKEEGKHIQLGKPGHSKHSSIDFANKENLKPSNGCLKETISSKNEADLFSKKTLDNQTLNDKYTRSNYATLKPHHIARFDSLSKQPSKQTLQTSDAIMKKEAKVLEFARAQKSVEKERNFYTLPAKNYEEKPRYSINHKNQSLNESQAIRVEKKNIPKNTNARGKQLNAGENGKHYRTATSIIGNPYPSTSKNQGSQLSQLLERMKPDSGNQKERKSISPFKKFLASEKNITPKENSKGGPKVQKLVKDKTEKNLSKVGIEISDTKIIPVETVLQPKLQKNMENSMQQLIVKTDFLEEQLSNILNYVSSFKSEEAQLKEKVKTQEDQIKSLQETLVKYETEMNNLKARKSVCKTEGDSKKRSCTGKENSDLRLITTTDTSSHESPFTEPSSSYLTCKEITTKRGKTSPFSTVSSGYNSNSTKNNPTKVTESLLTEYKNFLKKGFLAQNKNKLKW